jgi:hypothetical protein
MTVIFGLFLLQRNRLFLFHGPKYAFNTLFILRAYAAPQKMGHEEP